MTEIEKRIAKAWDEICERDDMSDDELVRMAAARAGVTYGEANAFLRGNPFPDPKPANAGAV